MKWVGISGTWQLTSQEVEQDVRTKVREIIKEGNGIVTGGALGVDSFAAHEVVSLECANQRIKICLPVTFELYKNHYRKRASEGVITSEQAENLIHLLTTIYETNPEAIIENTTYTVCDKDSYYARNGTIVDLSDELLAFQVNGSSGTQDTINKAKAQSKPVEVISYNLPS